MCSSAVAECWHTINQFNQFVVDDVDHNLFAYTFHGIGVIVGIAGMSTVGRILCRAEKIDELQAVGHIHICNCVALSMGFNSQRHEILNAQCYADIWVTINLLWKVSLLFRSPRHPWSAKMQAVHRVHVKVNALSILCQWLTLTIEKCQALCQHWFIWYCQVLQ